MDVEIMSGDYAQLHNSERRSKSKGAKGGELETTPTTLANAKANHNSALKALEAAKLAITTAGAEAFELYGNLLADEARQPWEKIIKAQVTRTLWEDIYGETHM